MAPKEARATTKSLRRHKEEDPWGQADVALERTLIKVRRGERFVSLFNSGPSPKGVGDAGALQLAQAEAAAGLFGKDAISQMQRVKHSRAPPPAPGNMADFAMPEVSVFVEGWGPPPNGKLDTPLGICDFVDHLDKFPVTRIGRICDFTASGQRFQAERGKGKGKDGKGKGKGNFQQVLQPGKDEEGFVTVDNRAIPGKSAGRGKSGGKSKGKGKGLQVNYQEGILGQKQKPFFQANQPQGKGGKGGKKGGAMRRGQPSYKEWSVQTRPEWTLMRELMLTSLSKLQIDSKAVKHEDVMWCGKLHTYSKSFDRLTTKAEKPMRRFEDLNFFNVTASDDPLLPELLQADPEVSVIATDHVLACLVAATRSVYSWDIIVSKVSNKLIFDKRDGGALDFLSVNETAQDPPNADDKDSMNGPLKLGQEASCINQNFSQMVLDPEEEAVDMEHPNPFEDEDEGSVASGAYRYRKITLPGNSKGATDFEQNPVSLIVRTEVNCKMPGATDSYMSVKALNEYDPKPNYNWRLHLESQRGACLATELKNNAFKLGRWTAQALLAGCDTMKVGYVSRQHPKDPWSHAVLGTQTYATDGFAEQIGLTRNNMYAVIRNVVDLVMSWEDGKYLLLKDPTKSMLRIHEIPWDTFAEEDDDEDDGEAEDDQELDEDGNAVPQRPA
ncbi:unnamed protein product [Polarella glacialis]|uniref:Eukaryotic translation initiation factor 3 subunit 7 n=1 Tax=Polarella glacialis TaxID=89957 RepID=A0A813JTR7_POLGL|nr:unnamed protein product [Polarella glacialis]